ncbi:MAG: endonuclease/exonuclease/phosphatase family protein [Deltaproteobacteria bacterium]|nr:endonuclease/exonuclease/phosphatase family protein [Deltaproteobacteria bacterium]
MSHDKHSFLGAALSRSIIAAIQVFYICSLSTCMAADPSADFPQPLRVMTYNIRAADYGLKGIITSLDQGKADIIALQEVDKLVRRTGRIDQPKRIAHSLGMYYVFRKHFSYQGGEFGLALLSRYKIDQVERLQVRRSNLILLKARVHTPGQPIIVIVVHFHPTNPLDKASTKKENDAARLREARRALELATTCNAPVLIMGDFNDNPGSTAYSLFAERFQDCCGVAGGIWEKTWPASFPITRIDYIWVSPHFRVLSCHALDSSGSDHLPVIAEIQPMKDLAP